MRPYLRLLLVVLLMLVSGPRFASAADPGFLVLGPDRGFLGNDELREAFEAFKADVPASVLAFATDEQAEENLADAIETLRSENAGVSEVVVLPVFLTEHHALYVRARQALGQIDNVSIRFAEPLGSSYLAEEILFDRVRTLLPEGFSPAAAGHGAHGAGHGAHTSHGSHDHSSAVADDMQHGVPRLVVVASGAQTEADAKSIATALEPMARRAAEKFGLAESFVEVLYAWSAPDETFASAFDRVTETVEHAGVHGEALVVPFNLAPRLTTMMADWTRLQGRLSAIPAARFDGAGVVPHENVARWMIRTAHAHLPLAAEDIGVILVPHGSDYNWNEAMRSAMAPIRDRYVTEDAFSMVDPYVVERAVRRLEKKGVKAAVLVRVFSLESSFQAQAEYVLGLRDEYRGPHAERISSHLLFATTGGMEAHPLLAEVMLERALEISEDPSRETVVLVAHGTGGDAQNLHWMDNLERIATYIRSQDVPFRDVTYHTWREDWPDKREASIEAIRTMVADAAADGGTALVVPVRTIDRGPEADFLDGLTFRHGTGFAPHPNFVRWLDEMIQAGIQQLRDGGEVVDDFNDGTDRGGA